MEKCIGCGEHDKRHPYLAIVVDTFGRATTHVVCASCQRDPSHRKRPLKAGFFERGVDDVSHNGAARGAGSGTSREEQLADAILAAVNVLVKPLRKHIAALEKEIAALKKELQSCSKYKGIYTADHDYVPADMVSRSGCLWVCQESHTSGAEFDHRRWQMATKSH